MGVGAKKNKGGKGERTFEALIGRLEEIVGLLEKGDLPLEESIRLFEEGMRLAKEGVGKLDLAERKVNLLLAEGEKEQLKPFPPEGAEEL